MAQETELLIKAKDYVNRVQQLDSLKREEERTASKIRDAQAILTKLTTELSKMTGINMPVRHVVLDGKIVVVITEKEVKCIQGE